MSESLHDAVAAFPSDAPDWQVADDLNTPDFGRYGTTVVDASVGDARAILMTRGAWGKIALTAENASTPAEVRALCITVRDAHRSLTTLEMTDPGTAQAVTGMVAALLQAGLINQATHDALLALGKAPASWADLNNDGLPVTARDVGLARGAVA